jgi:hypothetical protein
MWFTQAGSAGVGKIGTGAGPVVTVALSGTPAPGQPLACAPALSTSALGSLSSTAYVWLRDDQQIAGADSGAYTLTNADAGATITCRASLTLRPSMVQMAGTSNALTVSGTRPSGGGGAAGVPSLRVTMQTRGRRVTTTGAMPKAAVRVAQMARANTGAARTAKPRCAVARTAARKGKPAARRFTCTVTLRPGRWTLVTTASAPSAVAAQATRVVRVR